MASHQQISEVPSEKCQHCFSSKFLSLSLSQMGQGICYSFSSAPPRCFLAKEAISHGDTAGRFVWTCWSDSGFPLSLAKADFRSYHWAQGLLKDTQKLSLSDLEPWVDRSLLCLELPPSCSHLQINAWAFLRHLILAKWQDGGIDINQPCLSGGTGKGRGQQPQWEWREGK